ncbi:protein Star-like [Oratosquilla oratoria]|uniref:protein Star-like n=1 Tax=Oratosquilla oratoria TaxID=337810 RepID=UPI003F759E5E
MEFLRPVYVVGLTLFFFSFLFLINLDVSTKPARNQLPYQEENGSPSSSFVVNLEKILDGPYTIEQDDPALLQLVRERFVYPASEGPLALEHPDVRDPSAGQLREILKILGNMRDGFFVECGALDGETRSNTLALERYLGWTGILIEADPKNFRLLESKNRNSLAVNACLSTLPYPNKVMFEQNFNLGKIAGVGSQHAAPKATHTLVQCLPFYSILAALNVSTVHYFSLDVEGAELGVLRTIPWDKVDIQTLSVEFLHGNEGKYALKRYMVRQGYQVFSEVTKKSNLANDYIFVKKNLLPRRP